MKKSVMRISLIGFFCASMLVLDVAYLDLVPEAEAVLGVRRRTARRTAVVVGSASHAEAAAAQQQAAAAQQQATQAEQEAAAAKAETAAAQQQAAEAQQQAQAAQAAQTAVGPLPLGTVTSALPAGCTSQTIGGVQYFFDGHNYFKAAFQGSQVVYVTAKP